MEQLIASPLFKGLMVLVVGAVLLKVAWRFLFPPQVDAVHLRVRCQVCGWSGVVGKYMKKCSKCNATALEVMKG